MTQAIQINLAQASAGVPSDGSGAEKAAKSPFSEKIEKPSRETHRERRYAQRAMAAELLRPVDAKASASLHYCGAQRHGADVVLALRPDGSASLGGLKYCGSVWTCPVCAPRIAAQRSAEMQALQEAAAAKGYALLLMTLTARHTANTDPKRFNRSMKAAAGALRRSRAWASLPIVGTVTRTETLLGDAGWHTHLHVVVVVDLPEKQALRRFRCLRAEWSRSLQKAGLSCGRSGFDVLGAAFVAAYVAKGGFAEEMTLGHLKTGRKGGRTPWELLRDAERGDPEAASRWVQYALAFKGQKQLTWSAGAAKLVKDWLEKVEPTDSAVVEAEPVVLRVWPWADRDAWRHARRRACALLRAAETGGDLHAAEYGPTDVERWLAEYPRPGPVDPSYRHRQSLSRMMVRDGYRPLVSGGK